jgi:signal transduction histidine kinase
MHLVPRFMRWSALSLRTKGLIVVGLPVLPMAVFWAFAVAAVIRQGPPMNTTARSLIVQASLARVFSDLLDADAGVRHNLFTDSVKALQRYHSAIDRLPADLSVLDNAMIDPSLRQSLLKLQVLVDEELAVLARLTARTPTKLAKMGEVEALDRSVAILEEIRALAGTMEKGQASLAALRSQENRRTQRMIFAGFLVISVACVGGGVLAALLLANSVKRRAIVLARNADRLAHGLPPEPLPVGEDEIGTVDARLREAGRLLMHRERDLRDRTGDLEQANRELEAFAYSVSHDLRAPLRAIDGFSEALESDCADRLDHGGKDSLRRVRAAARRMETIIDELLALSQLGRVEPKRQRVDIGGSAAAILAEFARRSPGRGVDITVAPGLMAEADPDLVHIALHNLLDNAWKYTGKTARARIEVGSSPEGSVPVFHVRDNGAGFDMAQSGKLFGAFQRLHTNHDFEGTGIGLATVQRIINRHGGRIWAESVVNGGATFFFTLEPDARTPV